MITRELYFNIIFETFVVNENTQRHRSCPYKRHCKYCFDGPVCFGVVLLVCTDQDPKV